jgi:transcriptional regulator with XRE-family HTH domain
LGIKLGVTGKMVSHYEQGASEFPLHKLPALLDALKVKFSYFFPDWYAMPAPADDSQELVTYLGRRVEVLPPGVVREQYVSSIREFAQNQLDAFIRIREAVK